MSEEYEPIIDALLEELLGGEQPPDLTQRILGAHDAATKSGLDLGGIAINAAEDFGFADDTTGVDDVPVIEVAKVRTPQPASRTQKASALNFWASAAVILVGASAFGWWYVQSQDSHIAGISAPEETVRDLEPVGPNGIANNTPPPAPAPEQAVAEPEIAKPRVEPDPSQIAIADATTVGSAVNQNRPRGPQFYTSVAPFGRELELAEPQSRGKVVSLINRELRRKWDAKRIKPLPAVTPQVWLERASQFLVGRKPTPGESQRFIRERDREAVVESMLSHSDFATHWADTITDSLVPNHGYEQGNAAKVAERQAFRDWLAKSIEEGAPWDQVAYELITATGSTNPGSAEHNPAAAFLVSQQEVVQTEHGSTIKVAATDKVCSEFLGREMGCARCHEHEGATQKQYHQIASFFSQMRRLGPNRSPDGDRLLVNVDAKGSDGDLSSADLFFTDSSQNGISVFPELDGQTIETDSGRVQDVDRRVEIAKLIVRSDDFARTTVNRIWTNGLGRELSEKEYPQLSGALAHEFQNHRFDIKPVVSWIVMSSAFDRRQSSTVDSKSGEVFASFQGRRETADAHRTIGWPLESIAKSVRKRGGSGLGGVNILGNEYAQVGPKNRKPGKADRVKQKRQELLARMAQEPLFRTGKDSLIGRLLLNSKLTDDQRVKHLFYGTVGRAPRQNELKSALELMQAAGSDGARAKALQNVVAVLLNSLEYQSQH